MKEAFIEKKFNRSTVIMIDQANAIIAEYRGQGLTLTLRQLYYQFVSRDLLKNEQREYKRLGEVVNNGRLAGRIDWDAIEDRTRNLKNAHDGYSEPRAVFESMSANYYEDIWADQPYRPEVWIEKDALVGVIERICYNLRVPFYACRGYNSQSEQYKAGKRFEEYQQAGKTPVVLHLGDHDPSGVDMTRDNTVRFEMFAGTEVEVRRLALNMDQVKKYKPPPNPTKMKDSRSPAYVKEFGLKCWELDALDPPVIVKLIRDQLNGMIDKKIKKAAEEHEQEGKDMLHRIASRWDDVSEFVRGLED